MQKTLLAMALATATAGLVPAAHADEGMWVPQQLPEIAGPLKKADSSSIRSSWLT